MLCETRIHFYLNTRLIIECKNPLHPKLYILHHDCNMLLILLLLKIKCIFIYSVELRELYALQHCEFQRTAHNYIS